MLSQLIQRCTAQSDKTLAWVKKYIDSYGRIEGYPDDIVCYYKLPYFLLISGERVAANHMFDYMKNTFFQGNKVLDFSNKKTQNPLMAKFWGYVLGWVAIASQKLGRFDIAYPMNDYLLSFQSKDHGGFATTGPLNLENNEIDIITTAQLGRMALHAGNKVATNLAAEFLGWQINHQSNLDESFYLFMDNQKNLIQTYPIDMEMIYVIKTKMAQQAYFMIGLPCAFLLEAYDATQNQNCLRFAKQYGDFALSCNESIKTFHFSHKVAWAMSMLYRHTQENKYLVLCESICEYLLKTQDAEGIWLKEEDKMTSLDQSVEIAIWLKEIALNLS